MRVLVCGATGRVGAGVLRMLGGQGVIRRALVRDPSRAKFSNGVEVVTADYTNAASLDAALDGVDGVFVMAPINCLVEHASAMAAAARRKGVRRLALLSSLSVEADDNEHATLHKKAEAAVRQAGCEWTIVRGGQFMSNTLRWAEVVRTAREVRPYTRNQATAIIHPADVSAVAAKALTESGHNGRFYGVTGGECISPSECVRILSDVLGFEITYVELSDADAEKVYVDLFEDTQEVREKLQSLRKINVPWEKVRPDVEQVLGRPPLTYRQWAAENAAAFC